MSIVAWEGEVGQVDGAEPNAQVDRIVFCAMPNSASVIWEHERIEQITAAALGSRGSVGVVETEYHLLREGSIARYPSRFIFVVRLQNAVDPAQIAKAIEFLRLCWLEMIGTCEITLIAADNQGEHA